jgi:hypothetical protein
MTPVDLTPGDRNGAFQLLECVLGQISSLYLKRKENQCNVFKHNVFDIVSCVSISAGLQLSYVTLVVLFPFEKVSFSLFFSQLSFFSSSFSLSF